jgi:hypothetical protein
MFTCFEKIRTTATKALNKRGEAIKTEEASPLTLDELTLIMINRKNGILNQIGESEAKYYTKMREKAKKRISPLMFIMK